MSGLSGTRYKVNLVRSPYIEILLVITQHVEREPQPLPDWPLAERWQQHRIRVLRNRMLVRLRNLIRLLAPNLRVSILVYP